MSSSWASVKYVQKKKKDFFKRVKVAECQLPHLQKPGSETALSMVNQDEGQKSSLVGAKAPFPDACGGDGDEMGQKYLDNCQEHKLSALLR